MCLLFILLTILITNTSSKKSAICDLLSESESTMVEHVDDGDLRHALLPRPVSVKMFYGDFVDVDLGNKRVAPFGVNKELRIE